VRVAAVDLGTNSTRLLVADVAEGSIEELHRETRITRLGEGVDHRRLLLPVAVARVRNCLADYRRTIERLGATRTLAVATSAVRDAENGEAVLGEIEWSYGFTTRLLSGDEEARLMRRGVAASGEPTPGTLIVDVGGGSTELILDDVHLSLDIGSVRLTERYLHGDPPTATELAACAETVRAHLPDLRPSAAIGVAGTITSIAALDLGLPAYDRARAHGHRLARAGAERQLARLGALPLAERRELSSLEPERAPAIVGGAVIVAELLAHYGLDELEVSEHDILDGAALAAAELPQSVEGDAPPGAFTCC
jgi:exopolyphosphatase/guanosine-5'-triphosphate,3'-diphosphate pyrophosphatase